MPTPAFRRQSYFPYPLEVLIAILARLLYRVRSGGTESFPSKGGVLVVANHLSYVDVLILSLACPRRLRFLGHKDLTKTGLFDWIFRAAGVISVSSENPTDGIRLAIKALRAGEAVCLFPEGSISRTGQLMKLKKGFEIIARRAGVPVVPAAIDGLWGSVFSFAGNKYIWKSPRLQPTPVFVAFGEPIAAKHATVATARRALLDLGAIAFEERPMLKRHLGREIVRSLARRPGHVEVIDRTAERRPVTAGRILAAAAALSRRIRTTIPERRVGIVLPPGAGAFIANLAVVCAGKVPVNLNFTAGRVAIEASLRQAGVVTVISADAMKAKLPAFPWPEHTVDLRAEIEALGGRKAILPWLVAAWILPNQVFANLLDLPKVGDREEIGLLFTSGSAGEPKGVVLTHRNILANCTQISSLSILPQTCAVMGCLPLFHSFGFTVTLWYPMLRGCRVITVPSPLDTRKIIDAIQEEKVSVLIGAPTFVRPMLKKATSAEFRSLDLVVTGAEKLPDDLHRGFFENFHLEILQGYGLTETTPVSCVNQPHPPVMTGTAEEQIGKKLGSVGRLLPGMTARIVDPETGAELEQTATGMVWLRGANVFPGYLADEEKTRAAMCDGWFITGDLGRFDEDGFLYIEGRLSRFSKIGGEMVPHGTIEQKIVEVFDLDQSEGYLAVVMGVPDPAKGESLVLLTTVELTVAEVRERLLAAGFSALWVPRLVQRVERIPVLGTGKLDLKECKRLAAEVAPAGSGSRAPV
jgi:acyl-[acyl-carrier-protein]-phospholipid O-acyltransferase/long-chain-fatty-acid--[acyl-carrier-protein] ligase